MGNSSNYWDSYGNKGTGMALGSHLNC